MVQGQQEDVCYTSEIQLYMRVLNNPVYVKQQRVCVYV